MIEHQATGHVRVRGTLAEPFTVFSLEARLAGPSASYVKTCAQDPGHSFDFLLDLAELYDNLPGPTGSFDLFLNVDEHGAKRTWRLGNFLDTDRDQAVEGVSIGDTLGWVHITGQGNVSIHFADEYIKRTKVTTRGLKSGPKGIHFDVEVLTYSRPIESAVGLWIGRQTTARHEFPVTVTDLPDVRRKNSGLFTARISGVISPEQTEGNNIDDIFDPFFEVNYAGIEMPARGVFTKAPRFRHSIRDIAVPRADYRELLVPYFTFRGKRLAFWSESFAEADYRYMRRLRWVSWLFFLIRPFSGIWLVGEAPYKAQDNGYQFFRWLRANHPERRAYYVIEADSPDRDRVESLGNVLVRHSRQHILYSLLASRFVGSHHAEYLYASRNEGLAKRSKGLRIFLQHGVTAQKNVTLNYGRRKMYERPADVFCVNSELEREIVIQDLEFLPSQVAITGFARFDELFAGDVEQRPVILVMPTWRDWLGTRASFERSKFREKWLEFLQNPALLKLAADHGMTIELVLHPNMRHHDDLFDVPGITIRQPGEDIQQLIKSASVLITDYSSVAWDFSFLDRPVLYFQFDQHVFIGNRVPFIDFATQLPGDIAFHADRLVELLGERLADGGRVRAEHHANSRAFLKHADRENCQRIYEVVRTADGFRARCTRVRNARWVRNAYDSFRASKQYHRTMTWLFRFASLLPKRDLAVFESDRGRSYGGSPRALYERLIERNDASGHPVETAFVNNTPMRLPDSRTRKIRRFSPRHYWTMGRAKLWVTNQNLADQFTPGKRTHYLQTWHGTPLKKMQNDVATMFGRDDNYHQRAQKLVNAWSSLISPSPYATKAFRSAFGFKGEILETGYPCNDTFYAPEMAERAQIIKTRIGIDDARKVVLYAPTFRDDKRTGDNWSADLQLDIEKFKERFGSEAILLIRFHPLVRFNFADVLDDTVIDVSRYPDTQDLLVAADVLITDYSSVMFDFANTGRQTLFFTYDIERYRDTLRGFYFDFESEAPGPLLGTSDEVLDALAELPAITEKFADRRAAFRERFCSLEDGHAADRVLDAVVKPS